MKDLLIHPVTQAKIQSQIESPPHALLISGKSGSGKNTIAQEIASDILEIKVDKLNDYPFFINIKSENNSISIDSIRSINNFLRLKVPSKDNKVNRIVYIPDAHNMRMEAQNSLLKTLEEPPSGTMIILTTDDKSLLLPTIQSRVRELSILPVSIEQATKFFSSKPNLIKFHALSQGQPGLLYSLMNNQSHPVLDDIELAKKILSSNKGDRLILVDDVVKDKAKIMDLLDALLRITHAALMSSSRKNDVTSSEKWQNTQATVLRSVEEIKANCQSKLVLDNLFLSI